MATYRRVGELAPGYKRKRARLVLENYVRLTPRNGRYTDALKQQRESFVKSFLAVRAQSG